MIIISAHGRRWNYFNWSYTGRFLAPTSSYWLSTIKSPSLQFVVGASKYTWAPRFKKDYPRWLLIIFDSTFIFLYCSLKYQIKSENIEQPNLLYLVFEPCKPWSVTAKYPLDNVYSGILTRLHHSKHSSQPGSRSSDLQPCRLTLLELVSSQRFHCTDNRRHPSSVHCPVLCPLSNTITMTDWSKKLIKLTLPEQEAHQRICMTRPGFTKTIDHWITCPVSCLPFMTVPATQHRP